MPELGYDFKDAALLKAALNRRGKEWQRLEFLGDRVVGLVVGDWLFGRFLAADEGELSRRLTVMVRESGLLRVGEAWNIKDYIGLRGGEVLTPSVVADAVEAVLGAVWLDGGLDAVRGVVQRSWGEVVDSKDEKDAKTRLQEWLQAVKLGLPEYVVVEEMGPDHDKTFKVMVKCDKGEALGEGRSKQLAGVQAAANLMKKLEKSDDDQA